MSKIIKTLTNKSGSAKFAYSNKGEKIVIDTDGPMWAYDNGLERDKNCQGMFELTPGTMEVCDIENVETMPKIVARAFQNFGFDISSVWFDDGEEEEEED